MKAKFFIVALVFMAGCSEQVANPCKIKVEPMNCNSPGSGAYITEALKQQLQKKGYTVTDDNPDVVISGAITVTNTVYHTTPEVCTSAIYINKNQQQQQDSILYKGEWGFSKNPKDFANITAKKISEKLQNNP